MGSKKQWRLQHSIWYVNGNWMASKCRNIHIFKGKILEKLSKCIKLPSPNKGLSYQGPPLCVLFGYVRTSEIRRIDVAPPTWNRKILKLSQQRRCKSNFNHSKLVGKLCLRCWCELLEGREGHSKFLTYHFVYFQIYQILKIGILWPNFFHQKVLNTQLSIVSIVLKKPPKQLNKTPFVPSRFRTEVWLRGRKIESVAHIWRQRCFNGSNCFRRTFPVKPYRRRG